MTSEKSTFGLYELILYWRKAKNNLQKELLTTSREIRTTVEPLTWAIFVLSNNKY